MGKVKGKIIGAGDMGNMRYTDGSGARVDIKYEQPYSKELGIVVNAKVSFDIVVVGGVNTAVAVDPINKGTIAINADGKSGKITETESGAVYAFSQPYLKESGFIDGQVVTYTLVNVKDVLNAVCLTAIPA